MAQLDEIESWVNPDAWDDKDEAQRVIDAIEESGSDNLADWMRIAGAPDIYVLDGAITDFNDACTAEADLRYDIAASAEQYRAAEQAVETARIALREHVRIAHTQGISKAQIHEVTKVSRPTIDKWLAADA